MMTTQTMKLRMPSTIQDTNIKGDVGIMSHVTLTLNSSR